MKQKISLFIFFFINFAFAEKYLSRISDYSLIWAIGLTLNYLLIWQYKRQIGSKLSKIKNFDIYLFGAYVVAFIFLFSKVPFESLNVDRWSVIASYWENFFRGDYVYFAESHMGNKPGPMPFYFILALPFYLIGELGLFSLLAVAAFIFILRWRQIAKNFGLVLLLLFVFTLPLMYEVICRSNLALNALLVLISIIYFLQPKQNFTQLALAGILIGLFMSIRNVFVITYIIAGIYALRSRLLTFVQLIQVGVVAICIFVLTFLPFVIGKWDQFLMMNPFIIQSNVLLPIELSALCIAASFVISLFVVRKSDVWFYSGLVLFLTASLHIVYKTVTESFDAAFYQSRADITYMIFCIPFLLYYLIANNSGDCHESTKSFG